MRGLTLSICAALLLTGCGVFDGDSPHDYRFYPSVGVYEDVSAGTYFYMSGGRWLVKEQLPPSISLDSHDFVSLELATDKPYRYYAQHQVKFNAR